MQTNMLTYFIRHTPKLDIEREFLDRLWTSHLIGIHFPHDKNHTLGPRDNDSLEPADYGGTQAGSVRRLRKLSENGGYVCAEYAGHEGCLVGVVEPKTPIKLLCGKWGDRHGLSGREAILKTLPLSKARHLNAVESAAILVGRPQQGTIMHWRQIGNRVANIVENRKADVSLGDLLPAQQEIMCSEFLRLEKAAEYGLPRLLHLMLPTGRTMRDVDIFGVSTALKSIVAQVTYQPPEREPGKIAALKKYEDGKSTLILFCDCSEPQVQEGIHLFPIKRVFDVIKTSPGGQMLLTGQF